MKIPCVRKLGREEAKIALFHSSKLCVTDKREKPRCATIVEYHTPSLSRKLPYWSKEDARNSSWAHFYQYTFVWDLSFNANMAFRWHRMWLDAWIWNVYCYDNVRTGLPPSVRWTVLSSLHLSIFSKKNSEKGLSCTKESVLKVYPWGNVVLSPAFHLPNSKCSQIGLRLRLRDSDSDKSFGEFLVTNKLLPGVPPWIQSVSREALAGIKCTCFQAPARLNNSEIQILHRRFWATGIIFVPVMIQRSPKEIGAC